MMDVQKDIASLVLGVLERARRTPDELALEAARCCLTREQFLTAAIAEGVCRYFEALAQSVDFEGTN